MNEKVLPAAQWQPRRAAHEARVDAWLSDHLERKRDGVKHPVEDFLFTYYSHRPAQLRRWHPGFGVVLADAPVQRHYVTVAEGVAVDPDLLDRRLESIRWIRGLLAATAGRPAQLGCFGLHEWAMVYRQTHEQVRHNAWPLCLSSAATAQVVEERGVRCTHFDAFRFFTEPARPMNFCSPQPHRCDHCSRQVVEPGILPAPTTWREQ